MRDTSKYRVNGVRVPSVTEVLDIAGLSDLSMVPEHHLEYARLRGSAVHEWLEGVDRGDLDGIEPDPTIAPYVAAYHQFKTDTGFESELIEEVVVDTAYCFAGTVDRTGTIPKLHDDPIVLDFKARAAMTPEIGPQLAGYGLALDKPRRRYGLQLRPDGLYRLHEYKDRTDTHDFLAALRVTHFKLRHGLARVED